MKIGLCATVKLFQMYLKDGPTPPLDPLHMHISPWYQFRRLRSIHRSRLCRSGPHAFKGMGCPDTGCASYELTDNLDFNPDGDGSFDADDEYWNNGAGRDPIGDSGYYDNSTKINTTFDGNGHV